MTRRVYGRTEYAEPLQELGVAADGADLGEEFPGEWVELIAFPEAAVQWIVRDGEEVADERAFA